MKFNPPAVSNSGRVRLEAAKFNSNIDAAPIEPSIKRRPVRIHSKDSVKRLGQLGFDPIAVMVKSYDDITSQIEKLEKQPRYSNVAMAKLLELQQKISNDLMRYGYARVPESVEVNQTTAPMIIQLTDGTDKRIGNELLQTDEEC